MFKKAEIGKKETIALIRNLIKIKSYSGAERNIAEFIYNYFKKKSLNPKIDKAGNVFIKIGNKKPILLFDGHIDTVRVTNIKRWKYHPFQAVIKSNYVYGCGAADMKAGIAAMMLAATRIAKKKLNCTAYFIFVVQEEPFEGGGIKLFLSEKKVKPSIAIITEPSNLTLVKGQRGRAEIKITIKGKPVHAAFSTIGENPLYKCAGILEKIKVLNNTLETDNKIGKGSITPVNIVVQNASNNSVPEECEILLDRRLNLQDTKNKIIYEIRKLEKKIKVEITKFSGTTYKNIKLTGENYFPSWEINESNIFFQKAISVYKKVFNKTPKIKYWHFSTDGSYIAGKSKIPVFGIGPGKETDAHTINEKIDIKQIEQAAKFYEEFILDIK